MGTLLAYQHTMPRGGDGDENQSSAGSAKIRGYPANEPARRPGAEVRRVWFHNRHQDGPNRGPVARCGRSGVEKALPGRTPRGATSKPMRGLAVSRDLDLRNENPARERPGGAIPRFYPRAQFTASDGARKAGLRRLFASPGYRRSSGRAIERPRVGEHQGASVGALVY